MARALRLSFVAGANCSDTMPCAHGDWRRATPGPGRSAGAFSTEARTSRLMGLVQFLTIAALVFVNGFFVAAEFALVKVRASQIDHLAEKGSWRAKLTSRALDRLDAYLSASQL